MKYSFRKIHQFFPNCLSTRISRVNTLLMGTPFLSKSHAGMERGVHAARPGREMVEQTKEPPEGCLGGIFLHSAPCQQNPPTSTRHLLPPPVALKE